jgi:hypothetical protein
MTALPSFVRNIESRAFWRELVPWLQITEHGAAASAGCVSPWDDATWRTAGYLRLASVLDPALTAGLARAVTTLRARNLHPIYVYVYDETWCVLDALRPNLSRLLGDDFEVLADVWAWHIDPRKDRGGWPVHRGWYEDVRGPTGAVGLVNVWVALTDATAQNACMHVVPLARDPHYPDDLYNLTSLDGLGSALHAMAGSALFWNANVAHWGGTCDPSFAHPRISLSFTVQRRAALVLDTPALRPPLSFEQRLDLIAEQFGIYGKMELTPECPEMRWAAMREGMRHAIQRLGALRG